MTTPPSTRPALYMIWDSGAPRDLAPVATGYEIAAVGAAEAHAYRQAIELDGSLREPQWKEFVERLLPDGMFTARLINSREVIGTVSAIDNPSGSRFYFLGGGAIAYLVVGAQHRGRGIGRALVKAAVDRLRSAGYRNIWVGVEETRLPAIKTYIGAGFVPFLHPPAPDVLESRWLDVFAKLGRAPATWPRVLMSSGHHPLVLWNGPTAVGVIRVDIAGDVAVFRRVAVREDLQGRGYGRQLLSAAEQLARDHGCRRVESHVDPGAIGFYEKCGFVRNAGGAMTKTFAD